MSSDYWSTESRREGQLDELAHLTRLAERSLMKWDGEARKGVGWGGVGCGAAWDGEAQKGMG